MAVDWKVESQRFDGVADLYDQFRPGYPPALVETILALTRLPPGAKLLEVGSGTGRATELFANRGCSITCVEPGTNLAAIAARKFDGNPRIRFEHERFEEWPAPEKGFNLVFSAQAWHWVPSSVGYVKAASVLADGGFLALFWNMHPDPQGPMFTELEQAYRLHAPAMSSPRPTWETLARQREEEITRSGYFQDISVHHFPWTRRFSVDQYLGLLQTYSDHLAQPEEVRKALFTGVAQAIHRHGGTIDLPYRTVLYLAQKA